jgi:hypothetical protein
MINSLAVIITLIIDNPEIDEDLDKFIDINFYTLCEYSYRLFKGINIPRSIEIKEDSNQEKPKINR